MADKSQLIRGLNLRDTTALVVGTIIGTGVFLKTAKMAQAVGSPGLVLLAWVAAGILSLASARVPYAMARDGLFFSKFAQLSAKQAVPIAAIILQGIWASVLAISATFDQLTDGVIFASMIFYASCCVAVIVFRKKLPNAPRPYRTLGYPVVPILFVIIAAWLLVDSVVHNTVFSVAALGLILLGLPVYFLLKKNSHPVEKSTV